VTLLKRKQRITRTQQVQLLSPYVSDCLPVSLLVYGFAWHAANADHFNHPPSDIYVSSSKVLLAAVDDEFEEAVEEGGDIPGFGNIVEETTMVTSNNHSGQDDSWSGTAPQDQNKDENDDEKNRMLLFPVSELPEGPSFEAASSSAADFEDEGYPHSSKT
jgi:hypothetical protein